MPIYATFSYLKVQIFLCSYLGILISLLDILKELIPLIYMYLIPSNVEPFLRSILTIVFLHVFYLISNYYCIHLYFTLKIFQL